MEFDAYYYHHFGYDYIPGFHFGMGIIIRLLFYEVN